MELLRKNTGGDIKKRPQFHPLFLGRITDPSVSNGVRGPASILPLIRHTGMDVVNTCGAWAGGHGEVRRAMFPQGQLICSKVTMEGMRRKQCQTVAPLSAEGSIVST